MFEKIKKNFGFGCMRLPLLANGEVDTEEFSRMVDYFMAQGFNYFDTAHGYLDGKSETAIRECVAKRYPREDFVLANKLTDEYFDSETDIPVIFEKQLEACGVDYFDFYLMHGQRENNYHHFKECRAYEKAIELKKQGKIKHLGISYHGSAEFLDKILKENPEVEFVLMQLNYLDWDDPAVQSKKCYEVCRKHSKPVAVMEPVKGGSLVNLPDKAKVILEGLHGGSAASYAIRFAAGHEGVYMVLSGMSDMQQMRDNLSYMSDFKPLDERELKAVKDVVGVFRSMQLIPCTACKYCTAGCPMGIPIPDLFACMNARELHHEWNSVFYYGIHTKNGGKASACIKCGKCEASCPQHLPVRKLLEDVAKTFENN